MRPPTGEPDSDLRCACANLRRASRAVTRAYDVSLREVSLNSTQFTLLQALEGLGAPARQRALARMLGLDKTTLSRTLRPLDYAELIERAEGRWSVTGAGRFILRHATRVWELNQTMLRERLGHERWERLTADLAVVPTAADAMTIELRKLR